MHSGMLPLLLVACLAGCGRAILTPTRAADPPDPDVTVHGVIEITEPGVVGPQGAPPPHFLRVDDGRRLGLVLAPESAILGDVTSDGRGVTITGSLRDIVVEPIGLVWDGIVVSSFRFDTP